MRRFNVLMMIDAIELLVLDLGQRFNLRGPTHTFHALIVFDRASLSHVSYGVSQNAPHPRDYVVWYH